MATYTLNDAAVKHARHLIDDGSVDADTWFLGIEPDAPEDTKERYHFPVGDFSKVYRQGLIAAAQRVAQNDYGDIAKAAKQLLEHLDDKLGIDKG